MLLKKISKYGDNTYLDLLNHLYQNLVDWILQRPEIIPIVDVNEFKLNFFHFLLNNNNNNNNNNNDEYFSLKYSEDIVDLFIQMKNICTSYNTSLLENKNYTSDDLSHFIFNHSLICETSFENEIEEEENENILDYEISY